MSNEGEVYFGLFGDFEPSQLRLGITPTRTKKKAEPIPKKSCWIYSSGKVYGEAVDVYKLASSVVKALEPHADEIVEIKRKLGLYAVLEVVLTISADERISTPAIGFESHVISFLNKVGATIDVDTYRGEGRRAG
jgi:hypothetical protein